MQNLRNFSLFRNFSLLKTFSRGCKTPGEAAKELNITSEAEPAAVAEFVDDDDEQEELRAFYESKRNKSRLLSQHRNVVLERKPYRGAESWVHNSLRYKRTMIGRYGIAGSGEDPRICFPTTEELAEKEEYNRVAYPDTIQQMRKRIEDEKRWKREKIQKREDEIALKLSKLEKWSTEFRNRVAKAEAEAQAAKDRRERLVEEVRRHFGFKLDARDERFKELLAQKEKEDKKKQKEARKKAREEKVIAKLLAKGETDTSGEKTT
ncbi:growth arrest and DNA damage-inducible proteins-interacting protein 1 [Sergentomyia squamirostris]